MGLAAAARSPQVEPCSAFAQRGGAHVLQRGGVGAGEIRVEALVRRPAQAERQLRKRGQVHFHCWRSSGGRKTSWPPSVSENEPDPFSARASYSALAV